jgi:hypothetical protein
VWKEKKRNGAVIVITLATVLVSISRAQMHLSISIFMLQSVRSLISIPKKDQDSPCSSIRNGV